MCLSHLLCDYHVMVISIKVKFFVSNIRRDTAYTQKSRKIILSGAFVVTSFFIFGSDFELLLFVIVFITTIISTFCLNYSRVRTFILQRAVGNRSV